MREVFIVGVGMTPFGKHLDRSVKDLSEEALDRVLDDSDVELRAIEAVWFSNATWGDYSGQHCIRGQVALRGAGIMGVPVTNVENACAGGATALHEAWLGVASGLYECTLAIGAEKLYHEDKARTFRAFMGGVDVECAAEQMAAMMEQSSKVSLEVPVEDDPSGAGKTRSPFMDFYSLGARMHMAKYGTTQGQLAAISSKNHFHSSMNGYAQFKKDMSVEEILSSRVVSWPLTVPMCAPVGDGAAAAVLCSGFFLRRLRFARPVKILASILGSGTNRANGDREQGITQRLSKRAYEVAGVGPEDISLAEVHDATAFGELHQSEALGFCAEGEGGPLGESGATRIGGRIPINTSGGLESRGHPIAASGLGMNVELVTQLRHEAGPRQVEGCVTALAENGGGALDGEEAAMGIHILERVAR